MVNQSLADFLLLHPHRSDATHEKGAPLARGALP